MPFASVAELKKSPMWTRMPALREMSDAQLERFVAVFNRVHARMMRNDGDQSHAEAQASAMAMSAAKNARLVKMAALDTTLHYFAPMMPEQVESVVSAEGQVLGAGEYNYSFIRENIDIQNLAVRGVEFDTDHDPGKPIGRIAGVLLPEQVPANIQVDPDAPFVVAAQYYTDTPEETRKIASISSAWDDVQLPDGRNHVRLFKRFTVTETPLNGVETGITKLAGDNGYKATQKGPEFRESPMADSASPEELKTKVASLEADLTAEKAKAAKLAEFQNKLASLLDAKSPDEVTPEKVASLVTAFKTGIDSLSAKVAALENERLDETANAWAIKLAEAGKIPAEAVSKWASLFIESPESAKTVADTIPVTLPPAGKAKAAALQMTDPQLAALRAVAMSAFPEVKA